MILSEKKYEFGYKIDKVSPFSSRPKILAQLASPNSTQQLGPPILLFAHG